LPLKGLRYIKKALVALISTVGISKASDKHKIFQLNKQLMPTRLDNDKITRAIELEQICIHKPAEL
jgi:hypothetical protein